MTETTFLTYKTGRIVGKKTTMHWKEYQTQIVEKHRVRLVGWPPELPFNIKDLSESELIVVLKGLTDGTCRWERVPLADIASSLAAKENAPPKKKRTRKRKGLGSVTDDSPHPKSCRIELPQLIDNAAPESPSSSAILDPALCVDGSPLD